MIIFRIILLVGIIHFGCTLSLISQQISKNAQISLMTCSPGPLLYQSWGHSAILIQDPQLRINRIYNYGTFDSNVPNFYVKFVRGVVPYFLNDEDYLKRFLPIYKYFHQDVKQQILNLTPYQKQQLFNFLEHNRLPKHKFYMYDQFYDNCAIRIKWALEHIMQDSIRFNYEALPAPMSFRQAIDQFLIDKPWIDFGIDLILGSPVDHIMSPPEYSFLPSYMYETFKKAEVLDSTGQWIPLVLRDKKVYDAEPLEHNPSIITPLVLGVILLGLIMILTGWEWKKKTYMKWVDMIIFGIYGLIGILLLGLWLGTEHKELAWNYNILWLLPTHLLALYFLFTERYLKFFSAYLIFTISINFYLLVFASLTIQSFHISNYPLILLITFRALWIIYRMRSFTKVSSPITDNT